MIAQTKSEERMKAMLGASPADVSIWKGVVSNEPLSELQAAKAAEWCSARYRSYDPGDNTYQPYGGGPRRTCAAPIPALPVRQVADIGG